MSERDRGRKRSGLGRVSERNVSNRTELFIVSDSEVLMAASNVKTMCHNKSLCWIVSTQTQYAVVINVRYLSLSLCCRAYPFHS